MAEHAVRERLCGVTTRSTAKCARLDGKRALHHYNYARSSAAVRAARKRTTNSSIRVPTHEETKRKACLCQPADVPCMWSIGPEGERRAAERGVRSRREAGIRLRARVAARRSSVVGQSLLEPCANRFPGRPAEADCCARRQRHRAAVLADSFNPCSLRVIPAEQCTSTAREGIHGPPSLAALRARLAGDDSRGLAEKVWIAVVWVRCSCGGGGAAADSVLPGSKTVTLVASRAPAAGTTSCRARSRATFQAHSRQSARRRDQHAGRGGISATNYLYRGAPKAAR